MGLKPKNKGQTNFFECCDLTKKVYLLTLISIRFSSCSGYDTRAQRSTESLSESICAASRASKNNSKNLSSGSLIRLLDSNMFSVVGDTTVTPGVHGLGCRKVIMSLWIFLRILPDKEGILDIFSVICSLLTQNDVLSGFTKTWIKADRFCRNRKRHFGSQKTFFSHITN